MNVGLRFGNWLYAVIPDSATEGNFLSSLFPQVNLDNRGKNDTQSKDFQIASSSSNFEEFSVDSPHEGHDNVADNEIDYYNEVMNLDRLIKGRGY